jgi:hypothetical protein
MKIFILATACLMALLSGRASGQVRSNALVINSPPSGTVVAPGQTISVSVSVNSGIYPAGIGIVGGQDGGTMLTAGPFSGASPLTFAVKIPSDAIPGPLGLSATGADSSGDLQTSAELMLDVERTDAPVSLRVDPPSMHFQHVGQSLSLKVTGVYADGSWHGLTHSPLLQMTSSDRAVAKITNGAVKAVSLGNTTIQVKYERLSASVPIYVSQVTTCAACR